MSKTYRDMLLDPRWQKKRLECLEGAGWACAQCSSGTSTLHVHHKAYLKGRKPWEYSADQLMVLCETCHTDQHRDQQRLMEAISRLDMCSFPQLLGYALGLGLEHPDSPIEITNYEEASGFADAVGREADNVIEAISDGHVCLSSIKKERNKA